MNPAPDDKTATHKRGRTSMGEWISRIGLAASAISFLFAAPAFADRVVPDTGNTIYRSECGSCHIAFPAQLLPKESWQALMAGLAKHFGTDASADAKTAKEIESYLTANASRKAGPTAAKPPLRITETRSFRHEHAEVPGRLWTSATVKSPANCGACHPGAEHGDFNEHAVRLPN